MSNEISTLNNIFNTVKYNNDDFSVVNTMGNIINNREFSYEFFNSFLLDKNNVGSYIWNCISAASDQVGEMIYDNVRHYIDLVSNVDTCKVTALRSMMKMFGFDYTIFDNIETIPIEVLNLLNILSINRKYLLNDGIIGETLKKDLSAHGVLSGDINKCSEDLSTYFSSDRIKSDKDLAISALNINNIQLDDAEYFKYITTIYNDLLSNFIYLNYNLTSEHGYEYKIYESVYGDLAEIPDIYDDTENGLLEFKKLHNISPSFNYKEIVNNIDIGKDTIENYSYPESKLLELELVRRSQTLSKEDFQKYSTDDKYSTQNISRYSYYRKAKVIDYINFINQKYFIDNLKNLSATLYDLDINYINIAKIQNSSTTNVIYVDSADNKVKINDDIIEQVAISLAITTFYILKLRDKLKIQTQKTYIKGTQNLLLYIINEYLIDYSTHQLMLSSGFSGLSEDELQRWKTCLSTMIQHNINNINVIEYFDDTQYYNQKTDTTISARYRDSANQAFWLQNNLTADDGMSYSLAQISNFYINTMAMKDTLSTTQMLSDFLATVYNVGADRSFYDRSTGIFTTKLSSRDKYTNEIYNELTSLSASYIRYSSYISDDYSYPDDILSNQISNVVETYIFQHLSDTYLVGLSVIYDKYINRINEIEEKFNQTLADYNNILSGDTQMYFISSNNKFCSAIDQYGYLTYKHDYFTDNPKYEISYLQNKLDKFIEYVSTSHIGLDGVVYNNIRNHELLDPITYVNDTFTTISGNYLNSVVNNITKYGFVDIVSKKLDAELDYGYKWLETRRNNRLDYLKTQLEQIRIQANNLKTIYNQLLQNFNACVAQYNAGDTTLKLGDKVRHAICRQVWLNAPIDGDNALFDGYCIRSEKNPQTVSQLSVEWLEKLPDGETLWFYRIKVDNEYPAPHSSSELERYALFKDYKFKKAYNKNGKFLNNILAFKEFMDTPTTIIADFDTQNNKFIIPDGGLLRGVYDDGVYLAVDQIYQQYEDLMKDIPNVANMLSTIGGSYDYKSKSGMEDIDLINDLIKYCVEFDEANFNNDTIVKDSNNYLAIVTGFKSEYTPLYDDFQSAVTNQNQQKYLSDLDLNKSEMTLDNISRIIAYSNEKDYSNADFFSKEYDRLFDEVIDEINGIQDITVDIAYDTNTERYCDGIFEEDTSTTKAMLYDDINDRTAKAIKKIDELKVQIIYDVNNLSTRVDNESYDKFNILVENTIESLNFFNDPQYIDKERMFKVYGGLSSDCYPNFNLQNITHPSYQIHPYLWNFIMKNMSDYTEIIKNVYSVNVEDLAPENIRKTIDSYYGEFGQSINKWLHNTLDYTGYTTRYEASDHYSTIEQVITKNEVVDYDGSFYPPAVQMLKDDYNHSLQSLLDCQYSLTLKNEINSKLLLINIYDENYVQYEKVLDDDGFIVGYRYISDIKLGDTLESILSDYISYQSLRSDIDEFFNIHTKDDGILKNITMTQFISYVTDRIPETFYGRFYVQTGITAKSAQTTYIYNQLKEYFDQICDITDTKDNSNNVYDIYRYGMDKLNNIYVLFKKYDDAATYKQKKNTKGQLWIRLCDHPIAFPAFTGAHPNVLMSKDYVHPLLLELSEGKYTPIDDMSYFYDFTMSIDGNYLFLVSCIKANGYSDDIFVQNYENPWIINCQINQFIDETIKFKILNFHTDVRHANEHTTGIRSGKNIQENPELSVIPAHDMYNYAYIGSFNKSQVETDFVYVLKKYNMNKQVELSTNIIIYPFKTGLKRTQINGKLKVDNFNTPIDDLCFSYDQDQVITFAHVENQKYEVESNTTVNSAVDLSKNVSGPVYSDPFESEMNSHDIFTENIVFQKLRICQDSILRDASQNEYTLHNMNADMSYIPSYPGISGETNIEEFITSPVFIELLGKSNNIDSYIANINNKTDPYFELSSIFDDHTFGRVYEDYKRENDNSMIYCKNGFISNKVSKTSPRILVDDIQKIHLSTYFDDNDNSFYWDVQLDESKNITEHNIEMMKLMVYSNNTLGCNPYHIAKLTDCLDAFVPVINYHLSSVTDNSIEIKLDNDADSYITVAGTADFKNNKNQFTNNHIYNIKNIFIKFDNEKQILTVKFVVDDLSKIDLTYIDEDQLTLIFFNENDLRMFNYYHILDEYGFANVYNGKIDAPSAIYIQANGWSFTPITDMYEQNKINTDITEYYVDKYGSKTFLNDIDCEKYDYLSDIYAFQGFDRIQFKYPEETNFDINNINYYFPTLNIKYPRSSGNFVADADYFKIKDYNDINSIFDNDQLFVIDLFNNDNIINNIGKIEIPMQMDDVECYRIYEKYTEFEDGSTISDEYDKYSTYDCRSMNYIKSITEFDDQSIPSSEWNSDKMSTVLDELQNEKPYITDFIDNFDKIDVLSGYHTMPRISEKSSTYTSYDVQTAVIQPGKLDLSRMLKLYVNYKKSSDGIHLYFNYFNYIDTPYIKIVNNRKYSDIIDDTYLHVSPGKNGIINIVVQLKYYEQHDLKGIQNVVLAKCQIYNVSDDKPKFIIKIIDIIQSNQNKTDKENPNGQLTIFNIDLDTQTYQNQDDTIACNMYVSMQFDKKIKPDYKFSIDFPPGIFQYFENINTAKYSIDTSNLDSGYMEVTVHDPAFSYLVINLNTIKTYAELANIKGVYPLYLDKVTDIVGDNDKIANIKYLDARITIK